MPITIKVKEHVSRKFILWSVSIRPTAGFPV